MDIRCPVCGEPWDIDELHEVAKEKRVSFSKVRNGFANRGCEAIDASHNANVQPGAAEAAILFDMMGDDIDGVAALLDDIF